MTAVEPEVNAALVDAIPGRAPKSTKAKLLDGIRWVAIAVVIGFAGYNLAHHWEEFWRTLNGIAWQSSALSLLAVVASIAVSTFGWQVMVDDLGDPIGYRRSAQICLVGFLGKYVPGSVWGYLLQMELGRKAGLARARIFTASLVQLGIGLVAATTVGLLAMPAIFANSPNAKWLLVLLPFGLAALHPRILSWGTSLVLKVLRRRPLDHRLRWATVGKMYGAGIGAYALQGVHLWLLANSIGAPGVTGLLLCVGAMALGMTAGTFAFLLPGGVGVRESVLIVVLAMAGGINAPQALAFATVSRVMFIIADLLTAGGAALTVRLRLPGH